MKLTGMVNSGKLTGAKQRKHTDGQKRSSQVNVPYHLFVKLLELKEAKKFTFTVNSMVAMAIENYIASELGK